jgi:hypothetical protein
VRALFISYGNQFGGRHKRMRSKLPLMSGVVALEAVDERGRDRRDLIRGERTWAAFQEASNARTWTDGAPVGASGRKLAGSKAALMQSDENKREEAPSGECHQGSILQSIVVRRAFAPAPGARADRGQKVVQPWP